MLRLQVLVFDILWAFLLLISASLVAEVANAFAAVAALYGGSAKAPGAMVAAVVSTRTEPVEPFRFNRKTFQSPSYLVLCFCRKFA